METIHNRIGELSVTYKTKKVPMATLNSTKETESFLRKIWNNEVEYRESLYVVYVNYANKVIGYTCMFTGNASCTVVDPRIIFQHALLSNASKLVIAHNHPSGNTEPSTDDIRISRALQESGKLLSLPIMDFCILTADGFYSFADNHRMG